MQDSGKQKMYHPASACVSDAVPGNKHPHSCGGAWPLYVPDLIDSLRPRLQKQPVQGASLRTELERKTSLEDSAQAIKCSLVRTSQLTLVKSESKKQRESHKNSTNYHHSHPGQWVISQGMTRDKPGGHNNPLVSIISSGQREEDQSISGFWTSSSPTAHQGTFIPKEFFYSLLYYLLILF